MRFSFGWLEDRFEHRRLPIDITAQAATTADPNNAKALAQALYNALPKSRTVFGIRGEGFVAKLDGTKVIIQDYYDDHHKFRDIVKPKLTFTFGTPGAPTPGPKVEYKDAYIRKEDGTSAPAGKPVSFSFESGTVQANGTVGLKIDGRKLDVSVSAGETYLQVADAVASALTNAGLSGVQTDGEGDVLFAHDFAGQNVSKAEIDGVYGLTVAIGSHAR